ncbi:hypothetical protein I5R92_25320 [Pseudomonas carnis]|uniref:hypothetical protein n=1 Tax=Pseudomonas carnis TaxID=2487355 RepID=UPI0018DA0519|nr:hypothetical protein [Pseudomonas carnis]MBH3370617.1 hypothetical protein [Pseudomonas carnis]
MKNEQRPAGKGATSLSRLRHLIQKAIQAKRRQTLKQNMASLLHYLFMVILLIGLGVLYVALIGDMSK